MNFFSLFNKRLSTADKSNPFKVDIHSHILPNIDDGVQSIKESISLIKKFKLLGYTKLITTPHIISDFYPNNQKIITEKLSIVREELIKNQIEISIEAGAEYYVDMNFLELIEEKEVITFMNHYVLFETSYRDRPIILNHVIDSLNKNGYIPILAHPERYTYLYEDLELYKALKAQGVLFQINAKSLFDKSKPEYKVAMKLIQAGLVDFVGSDAHRMRDMTKLESFLKSKVCKNLFRLNTIKNNQ